MAYTKCSRQSPAEQEWLKDHQGAQMDGLEIADGSKIKFQTMQTMVMFKKLLIDHK